MFVCGGILSTVSWPGFRDTEAPKRSAEFHRRNLGTSVEPWVRVMFYGHIVAMIRMTRFSVCRLSVWFHLLYTT